MRLGAPERPALALPDKPSIAVLPFQNMSGDPEQEYFADGIVEDITTALSRSRLAVRHRAQFELHLQGAGRRRPRGRARTWRALRAGRQRAQGRTAVRIAGQLVDATSGAHVWAERYDRDLADVFAVQAEIAAGGRRRDLTSRRQRRTAARSAQTAREPERVGGLSAGIMASLPGHGR